MGKFSMEIMRPIGSLLGGNQHSHGSDDLLDEGDLILGQPVVVAELAVTLANPDIRTAALKVVRVLITRVTFQRGVEGLTLELEGALTAMIGLAQNEKNPHGG